MAKPNYTTIQESNFSRGMDARSAESAIPEGYAEDIKNGDVIEAGVRKRVGYQGYAGNLPMRVESLAYLGGSTDNIELTLGSGIDLTGVTTTPLVVYGLTSSNPSGTNDFEQTAAAQYYPKWKTKTRKTFTASATTAISITAAEHGLSSKYLYVDSVESTSSSTNDYSQLETDTIEVNETSYAITATATNGTSSDISSFIFYSDHQTVAGESYAGNASASNTAWAHPGGTDTCTIAASTHNLNNYNILVRLYKDTGTVLEHVTPDVATVDSSTGQVDVTVTDVSGGNYYVVLTIVDSDQIMTVPGNALAASASIDLEELDSPWVHFTVYESSGTTLTEVIPDSYSYSEATNTLTISLVTPSGYSDLKVLYTYGTIKANTLVVTMNTGATSFSDSRPQLTVWGLDHATAYGSDRSDHQGWTTHIDAYRATGEQRVVAGIAGVLHSAQTYAEVGTTYKLASLYPSLQGRLASTKVVGPLIYETGEAPGRTRGYLTHSGGSENRATVTSAVYDSNTGYTQYMLYLPGLSSYNSANSSTALATILSSAISVTSGYEDQLTISEMPWSQHNGTFRIRAVTNPATDYIRLSVVNSEITSADYDDTGCAGLGSVLTDQITISAGAGYFLPGDRVLADGTIPDEEIYTVVALNPSDPLTFICSGITEVTTLGAGLRIVGRRTSAAIPLRNNAATPAVSCTNLVAGDMLTYTPVDRLIRVQEVNAAPATYTIAITGDGTTATATVSGGTTAYLADGRTVILAAGVYSGAHEIEEVTSTTTFTFLSSETASITGKLIGCTALLDEELEWEDTTGSSYSLVSHARWIPIEAPGDSWDLTPSTYIRHFESGGVGEQEIIRSVMVADNLYLTNYDDEVMKFDGSSIYRTGLLPWQPGLFLTQDTAASAKIVNDEPRTAIVSSLGQFDFATSDVDTGVAESITETAHGLINGQILQFSSTSGLPAGLSLSTNYYVVGATANTFQVSTTLNGAAVDLTSTGSGTHTAIKVGSAGFTTELKVALGAQSSYLVGQRVYLNVGTGAPAAGSGTYEIKSIRADAANGYVSLVTGSTQVATGTTGAYLQKAKIYKYYYRLNAIDENGNIVASAVTGADDHVIEMVTDAAIYHKLVGLPVWDIYDYDKIEVEIYRTKANLPAPYYKLTTLQCQFDGADGYISFTDSFADSDLVNLDVLSSISGSELGNGWSDPLPSKYLTSSGGSLVLANLRDYPELDIRLVSPSTLAVSDLNGKKLTFRRDSTQTGTATDMVDTAVYEWVDDSGEKTVSGITGTVGASFNANIVAHGLQAKDWVYLYYDAVATSNQPLTYAGWWQVASVPGVDNIVITSLSAEAGAAALFPTKMVAATAQENIPVLLGESGGQDGNMGMYNGNSTFISFQAMRKMAMAINATMRVCDTALSGQTTFTPWLVARAGNELAAGQLLVRQPRTESLAIEVVLPSSIPTGSSIFVNEARYVASDAITATEALYPSRVLISYQNYPEIFDRPTAVLDSQSESAVDVNPADGQEITGIIPFFGESAFGSAQQGGVVVIFKENSIYLLDIAQKRAGGNPLQKLDTRGLGCTAPYSIAPTRDGIMFANESGIYVLRRNLTIDYIGRWMDRKWRQDVNKDQLATAQGHHYALGNKYKLSLPTGTDTENSEVYVYDHTREAEQGLGAWTRYTNHPATGWLNLAQDAYMASTTGRIFSLRRQGDATDYRDDSSAIELDLTTRAINGGLAGIRKIWSTITSYWRTSISTANTTLSTAVNLRDTYEATTAFRMENDADNDGLSDETAYKILEVQHSVARDRKGSYLQVNVTNATIDEGVELVGLSMQVAPLSERQIRQAAETTG